MTDPITAALRAAQVPVRVHLWSQKDALTFTPVVLSEIFGDGRALFKFTSINDRPRYWILRGCSTWSEDHHPPEEGECVANYSDEIVEAIAAEFGISTPGEDEDQISPQLYPQIDERTGFSWGRMDWPEMPGIGLEPHPTERGIRLLAI